MKVSQTIAVSVSSVLFLGMMTRSNGLALAQRGGGGEVRLRAKMVSGAPQARQIIGSVVTVDGSMWKRKISRTRLRLPRQSS